jgi:hypothetical protein
VQELVYFTAGSEQKNYMADSLFDPNAVENRGEKKTYNVSWEDHLSIVTGRRIVICEFYTAYPCFCLL